MIYVVLKEMKFQPIGGVTTLFDYAARLNSLAGKHIAAILSPQTQEVLIHWLPQQYADIPVLPAETSVTADDTVIIPEIYPDLFATYAHAKRRVLAVLNWKYFDFHFRPAELKRMGVDAVMTNSLFSQRHLIESGVRVPITTIPHMIDTNFFHIATPIQKRSNNSILVMNRKNSKHLASILEYLKDVRHIVTVVNNVQSVELSALYNTHQIFINLGYPEGFCRPAAEAMASGCIVVGFTGGGGGDFMINNKNAFLAPDGDERMLIKKLNLVMHNVSIAEKQRVSLQARKTIVYAYTQRRQAEALADVFQRELFLKGKTQQIALKAIQLKKISIKKKLTKTQEVLLQLATEQLEKTELQQMYDHLTSSRLYKIWHGIHTIVEDGTTVFQRATNKRILTHS